MKPNMKKIYIILAGLAVVLGSACCNKINDDKVVKADDVAIEITVAELNPSTKAIKTGWTNGDIINVYLSDASSRVPDIMLTYDGEKWDPSIITDAVKERLQASGTIKGFWEASNTATTTGGDWNRLEKSIYFNKENVNTSGMKGYLTAYFSVSYTYSEGIFEATIDSWQFRSGLIQIVVSGVTHNNFCLTQNNIATFNAFHIEDESIKPSLYGAGCRMAAVENEDGVAFTGALNRKISKGETFTMYLYDLNTSKKYSFSKVLESDLSATAGPSLHAIKIPFSKFEEVAD